MKKIILILSILIISCSCFYAQNTNTEPIQDPNVPYRLFKTTNMWTYIMLETTTGKMWLIQYDINNDNRGGVILSDKNLAADKEEKIGRFTLYPTGNMWTFILLDQYEGSSWQVQWSFEEKNRFVIPIY